MDKKQNLIPLQELNLTSRFLFDEVLEDPQQFPAGSRYDADSLRAAHELISGKRALRSDALYYQAADASAPWDDEYLVSSAGNYNFYCEDGND